MHWFSRLIFAMLLASGLSFAGAAESGCKGEHRIPVSPGSLAGGALDRSPAVATEFGSYQVFHSDRLTLLEIHDRSTGQYHLLGLPTPKTQSKSGGDQVELRQEIQFADGSGVWSVWRNGAMIGLAFRNRDGSWEYHPTTQPQ